MKEHIKSVVIFDGICNLCNYYVDFILKHERSEELLFTTWQSETGQALIKRHRLETLQPETIIFVKGNIAYTHSAAILQISDYLKWPVRLSIKFLYIIPRSLRDKVYLYIAKNRYDWFGKTDICRISEKHQRRFL